jgi:hypothetical protein
MDFMETSFEESAADEHINAIWKASIYYLNNCINVSFDEEKGFND